jgi:aerobic-type carbon monoxide dehydrogenase small subunit (CoxS/CutS family)
MTQRTFFWNGRPIAFRDGETIATALAAAGVKSLGRDAAGRPTRWFCGIGACQNCLVRIDGRLVEACLTPARDAATVEAAFAPEEARA